MMLRVKKLAHGRRKGNLKIYENDWNQHMVLFMWLIGDVILKCFVRL